MDRRLDSWKEIGAFFDRDERTVKRWEKERGLPVHRYPGVKGRVYAYAEELSQWLRASTDAVQPPAPEVESSEPVVTPQSLAAPRFPLRMAVVAGIAVAVCSAAVLLSARLLSSPPLVSGTRRVNADAEQLYLKGRYYWNQRTPESLNQALDYFGKAVARDPSYAEAYAGLADTYNLIREYTPTPGSQAYPKAVAAARRALELDERHPGAHRALAFALFWGYGDMMHAEREFKRSIELDPRSAVTRHWFATFLATVGRHKEALEQIAMAQELDPASRAILSDHAWVLWTAGRTNEAVAELRQIVASDPSFESPHRYLSYIYLDTKDYPAYIAELREAAILSHDTSAAAMADAAAGALSSGGAGKMFEELLRWQKKRFAQGQATLVDLAALSAHLGRKAEAISYLATARRQHIPEALGLSIEPAFRTLESEPAYRDLLSQTTYR
jgi:tetratricopeptide (TPR) repeat protein